MDSEDFRKALVRKKAALLMAERSGLSSTLQSTVDDVQERGDRAVSDLDESTQLIEASAREDLLKEVEDALSRIIDGTYGRCMVDGQFIENKRLEQAPWARYCLKHQEAFDLSEGRDIATL